MKTIVNKTVCLKLLVVLFSIIASIDSMKMFAATPSWLTSDYVAGPFYIKNNYEGFASPYTFQYLYDGQENFVVTEANCCDVSLSDATNYSNMARVSRNTNGTQSSAYVNNNYYRWVIEAKTIDGTTRYLIKNIGTGRYFHTGPFADYYSLDGDNNSLNLYAWNATLVSGATQIDGSSEAEKELSYYCFHLPNYSAAGAFTSRIIQKRWAWGDRPLHGELLGGHTDSPRPTYVFFTSNDNGWGTKDWNFVMAEIVPAVNSAAASSVASTSATLNGEVVFNGSQTATISARGFKYSTNTDFNPASEGTQVTAGTGGGAFNASATGLTSGITYYYYAYATNSTGTTYSDVKQTFTTTGGPSLTTSAATAVGNSVGTMNANIANNGGSNITDYGFYWSTTSGFANGAGTKVQKGTSNYTGNYSHQLTGLVNETPIYYKAYATNAVTTTYGAQQTFTPTCAISIGTGNWVTTLKVEQTGSNETTLTLGNNVTAFTQNFNIQGTPYTSYSYTTSPFGVVITWPGTPPASFNIYLHYTTVASGVSYQEFLISGVNGQNTCSPTVAPTVSSPTATNISHNSATLGATVTDNGGTDLTARGTVYKTSAGVTASDNALAQGGTTVDVYSHSRTGLSSQTLYYYKGYATNSVGTSLSSESSFRTLSSPATQQASSLSASVSNSTTSTTSNAQITIGTAATFPGSGATQAGYLVVYSTGTPTLVASPNGLAPASAVNEGSIVATSATNLPSAPSTTVNVTGLNSCATYNFLIVPYTWDGTNASTYNYLTASAPTVQVLTQSSPYGGTPWVAGDTLDSEFFDYGGEGCAFHEDGTSGGVGLDLRTDFIASTSTPRFEYGNGSDAGNGNVDIGWINAGEWVQYTINVTMANYYKVDLRAATPNANQTMAIYIDNVKVGNEIPITVGDWQTYNVHTTSDSIYLTEGLHKLKVYATTGGVNYDWAKFYTQSTVTTTAASSISATQATLNGTVNAYGLSTTVGFNHGTSTAYGTDVTADQSPVSSSSATSVSKTVTGLTPNTVYHFRVNATNSLVSVNGNDLSFTTLHNAPTIGAGSGATRTSLVANWSAPTGGGAESFTYTVEIDDDSNFGSVNATQTSISSATLNHTFTGLTPNTTYYYRVKVVNAGGSSLWSSVSSGYATLSTTAPVLVTNAATFIASQKGTMNGNISDNGGANITDYGFYWSTTPGFADGTGTKVQLGTTNYTGNITSELTGLTNGTNVYYKAYAANATGTTYGAQQSFTPFNKSPFCEQVIYHLGLTGETATRVAFTIENLNANTIRLTLTEVEGGASLSGGTMKAYSQSGGNPGEVSTTTYANGQMFLDLVFSPVPAKFTLEWIEWGLAGTHVARSTNYSSFIDIDFNAACSIRIPTVETTAATSVGDAAGTMNGNISYNGGADLLEYGFYWSTTADFADGAGTKVQLGTSNYTGNISSELTGLTNGTPVYYKAYATNGGGTAYGAQQTFTPFKAVSSISLAAAADSWWADSTAVSGASNTRQITATISPEDATNQTLTWTSSDESVATVNASGLVTSHATGTTLIRATAHNGVYAEHIFTTRLTEPKLNFQSKSTSTMITWPTVTLATAYTVRLYSDAACTVRLTGYPSDINVGSNLFYEVTGLSPNTTYYTKISAYSGTLAAISGANAISRYNAYSFTTAPNVTSVEISKETLDVYVGGTGNLTATVYPGAAYQGIVWTSSDEDIATVDANGVVTGVAEGVVTIRAAAEDNTSIYDECEVTVSEVTVESITLDRNSLYLATSTTKQLTATVLPANAPNKTVTWSSSNTNIATVNSSGLVTAVAEGTAVITATSNAEETISATCFVTVVEISCTAPRIALAPTSPTIDNQIDDVWDDAPIQQVSKRVDGSCDTDGVSVAQWRAMYDADSLYFLVEVTDANRTNNYTGTSAWNGDAVEIYLAGTNFSGQYMEYGEGSTCYNTATTQLGYAYNNANTSNKLYGSNRKSTHYNMYDTDDGYNLEMALAWSDLDASSYATILAAGYMNMELGISRSTGGDRCARFRSLGSTADLYNNSTNFTSVYLDNCSPIVNVDSVVISPTESSLVYGESMMLEATVYPDSASYKNVSWSSTNEGVVIVSASGEVTGVGSGTAMIIVTTLDGGFKDTAYITVSPACEPIIVRTGTAPNVTNEIVDAVWMNAPKKAITQQVTLLTEGAGNEGANNVLTNMPAGYWRALYDNTNLYLLVEVIDDNPWHNNATDVYKGDGIEIYLDGDNNPELTSYTGNQHHTGFNYIGSGSSSAPTYGISNIAGSSSYKVYRTSTGYNLEVAFPWTAIGGNPQNGAGIRMDITVNQTDETAGTTSRRAQVSTFANTMDLYQNPSWFTFVPFFEVTEIADLVVEPETDVVLSANTSIPADLITWTSNPEGNGGTGYTNTVNQDADTEYTITGQITGCATTSKVLTATLSNLYLRGTIPGGSNTAVYSSTTEAKGNRLVPVQCSGNQGSYTGDYYLLWKVPAGSTSNINAALTVWDGASQVSGTSVSGGTYDLTGASDAWVRWIYNSSSKVIYPAVSLYETSNVWLTTNAGDQLMTRVPNTATYQVTLSGSSLSSYLVKTTEPKSGNTNAAIWKSSSQAFTPVDGDVLFTWDYATNCLSWEILTKYRLAIGSIYSNELSADGTFTIDVPCAGGVAQLQYSTDGSTWSDALGYVVDLMQFYGYRTTVSFAYHKEYDRTEFGTPSSTGTPVGIEIATIEDIGVWGEPAQPGQGQMTTVQPQVTGVTNAAIYQWRESLSSNMSNYTIVANTKDFTPQMNYSETRYYQLKVSDSYCSQLSNVVTVVTADYSPVTPDFSVNSISVNRDNNTISAYIQNWGDCELCDATTGEYTLVFTVIESVNATLNSIAASTAQKVVLPKSMTEPAVVTVPFTFSSNNSYKITVKITPSLVYRTRCGNESDTYNNQKTINVCTFDRTPETIYYQINNKFVNNLDSLCTLKFKTLKGAIDHLKSDDGFVTKTATAYELYKNIVFQVAYTGLTYESSDALSFFGAYTSDNQTSVGWLVEGLNNVAAPNPNYRFTVIGAVNDMKPLIEHPVIRNSKNVTLKNIKMLGTSAEDNALDVDNGKPYYTAALTKGELSNANIVIEDCEMQASGQVAISISGVEGLTLTNNIVRANDIPTTESAQMSGAAIKIITSKDVSVTRNNIYSGPATGLWLQNNSNVLAMNNVIWMPNSYNSEIAGIRLFNRNDALVKDASGYGLFYNTLYIKQGTNTNPTQCFVNMAGQRGGIGASAGSFGNIRMKYNNFYSHNTSLTSYFLYNGVTPVVDKNNFYVTGSSLNPSTTALQTLSGDYRVTNVTNICGSTGETEFVITDGAEALNIGSRIQPGTADDILNASASYNDRLRNNIRPENGTAWTIGAHQAGGSVLADTIIWTNNAGDGDWDNYSNWIIKNSKQQLNCLGAFNENLTVIIPAPSGSQFYSNSVNIGTENKRYPDAKTPSVVINNASLYMKNLMIEYGGSLLIQELLGKYINAHVELLVEDRNEWILVGPNIRPYGSDGETPRAMVSGDYFLSHYPHVYMQEMTIDESSQLSWGKSFASLEQELTPTKCFAIRIPNQYGPYKQTGDYVFRNDQNKALIGSEPVKFSFKGQFQNEIAPTINTISNQFVIAMNTFMSNIDAKKFLQTHGGQIAIWSFNEESQGTAQKGSFTTYNLGTIPDNTFIKPMHAFLYLNSSTQTLNLVEGNVCDVNSSTKYRAKATPPTKPTLDIVASFGDYSSKSTVIYDEMISADNYDLFKVLSPYEGTPELFYYNSEGTRLQTKGLNTLNQTVDLGLKIGIDAAVKFTINGAEMFEEVYLIDKQLGTIYDLKDSSSLEVSVLQGSNPGRFSLKFASSQIITDIDEDNLQETSLKIYTEDNQHIVVSSSLDSKITSINVVDMAGRVTQINHAGDFYAVIDMSAYPAGVYTVKAVAEKSNKTEKVVIK